MFDETEEKMASDINSGKTQGKSNFGAMVFRTNMEAAEAIARHLRLRYIGGQVGIEFYAKFIFISYRTILASAEFTLADEEYGQWDAINSAWEQVGKGVSGTGGVLTSSQIYYDARTGQTLYASPTVAAMEKYARGQGYELDFSQGRFHHEIYLSDVRRCQPEKLKTVIRQPIKPAERSIVD